MKHVIRTSDRGTFRSCRQEWDWSSKIRNNLEPRARYQPFEDGTVWHAAMETYYNPETWHLLGTDKEYMVHAFTRKSLLIEQDKIVKEATNLYEEDILPDERLEEYDERYKMLSAMLEHYFTWAPTVDNFKPVKIEIEFEVPIIDPKGYAMLCECHGWPVFYQGRLDGIAEDIYGNYWILEHKTTGQMGDTAWLDLDAQCGSYAWAMRELGLLVKGIYYTQALKAAPKKPDRLLRTTQGRNFSVNKQQRVTYDMYRNTLIEHGEPLANYVEFLTFLQSKPNPFCRRITVYRNSASLDYIGKTVWKEAKEMIHNPVIYPNPGPFNCNWCRFREPCIAKQDGLDWQFILNELYVERK